ncbi:hypothetical protein AYJ57_17985 [Salipiger sp. CCB-MM3]|uniref:TOBE domain-containing protein n=1 Tax=Salipiger sp. CCB-MM3 TaxID=1792508 RepID=UPI00080AA4DF|nr:TOBE domain-containing protein [Salipiger sp. CCB-MM3]ANT62311.1 hypothetical protein AYJ57_17985 [Salipiger sp. CCB-MM3]
MIRLDTPLGRLSGRATSPFSIGDRATLFVRPELMQLSSEGCDCGLEATVEERAFEGSVTHLGLRTPSNTGMAATLIAADFGMLPNEGDRITAHFSSTNAIVLPDGAGQLAGAA